MANKKYEITYGFFPDGVYVSDSYTNKSHLYPYHAFNVYQKHGGINDIPYTTRELWDMLTEAINDHRKDYGIEDKVLYLKRLNGEKLTKRKTAPKLPSNATLNRMAKF